MLGESYMLQFFTGKLQAWYMITMVALHLLPLPLLKMVERLPDYSYWRVCRNSRYFLMLYLILLILLQATGIRDFMQMLNVSLVILFVICVGSLFLIYWEFFHNKNKQILPMINGHFSVLRVCLSGTGAGINQYPKTFGHVLTDRSSGILCDHLHFQHT